MRKFGFLTDLHYGYERRNGHKVPLHDMRAFNAAYAFLKDFKPDVLILGGDILDCGAISHHSKGKPGRTEGLRLVSDARDCAREIIAPLAKLGAVTTYITGNHEHWLEDITEETPGLEGLLGLRELLSLPAEWTLLPQGKHLNLGKLTFIHGDQLSGGEHIAKAAVTTWERSIRFGHVHTFQTYTKTSPIHEKLGRTGVAVPCLCSKDVAYGKGRANRWVQGFNYGVVFPDGTYADTVAVITNGKTWAGGKVYQG